MSVDTAIQPTQVSSSVLSANFKSIIQGIGTHESVLKGTRGVANSVISSTLIIVFTFLPLCLLSGGSGAFIRPLPVVIIAAITASMLVAIFVAYY